VSFRLAVPSGPRLRPQACRTVPAESTATTEGWTAARVRSRVPDWHSVCPSQWHSVADASAGTGLRFSHDVLAGAGVHPIARLRPGCDVTLFSLPTSVDTALDKRAATKALNAVAAWKDTAPSITREHRRSIVVYLEESTRLRVMEDRVTLSRRSSELERVSPLPARHGSVVANESNSR
jgi:hypothetical protein